MVANGVQSKGFNRILKWPGCDLTGSPDSSCELLDFLRQTLVLFGAPVRAVGMLMASIELHGLTAFVMVPWDRRER
jgi:hypothetical protein